MAALLIMALQLPLVPLVSAQSPPAWHAPTSMLTNNLTFALTGPGTNGFIYNTSAPSNAIYNYCNMPHALSTPENYPFPDLERYELVYAEVTHRHHKRTPYASNMFPREDWVWECGDTRLKFYGEAVEGKAGKEGREVKANRIWWKAYQDPLNPLRREEWHGDCQFPQQTKGGLEDSRRHGENLYNIYGKKLHLLPRKPDSSILFRVTSNVITSQVAGALIHGMYPHSTDTSVPVHQQPPTIDSLQPSYSCPAADSLRSAIMSEPRWKDHLEKTQPLFAKLDALSGVDPRDSGWHVSWDHYFDALTSRLCHQIPLPCNVTNPSDCVSKEDAETVLRLGQWEYSHLWRDSPRSLEYSSLKFGVFLNELVGHIQSVVNGDGGVKYRHNVAHDGSMSLFLSALQVEEMVWPGMGAEVVVEVWTVRKGEEKGEVRVRVLWGGRVLRSSSPELGVLDMVKVETLVGYLEGLVGKGASKVVEKCGY